MYTNTDIILKILKDNGWTPWILYTKLGNNRRLYTSIETNSWTRKFLKRIQGVTGIDLTMFANSEIDKNED